MNSLLKHKPIPFLTEFLISLTPTLLYVYPSLVNNVIQEHFSNQSPYLFVSHHKALTMLVLSPLYLLIPLLLIFTLLHCGLLKRLKSHWFCRIISVLVVSATAYFITQFVVIFCGIAIYPPACDIFWHDPAFTPPPQWGAFGVPFKP